LLFRRIYKNFQDPKS